MLYVDDFADTEIRYTRTLVCTQTAPKFLKTTTSRNVRYSFFECMRHIERHT